MGSASQRLDRQLFELKIRDLSREMQIKSVASDKAAFRGTFAGDGGLAGSPLIRMVDGQLTLLGAWLAGLDRITREVWQIQGETVTPEFIREVLVQQAMTLIAARVSTVKEGINQKHGVENPHAAQRHLAMEIRRLQGKVHEKYEIEVRTLGHQNAPMRGLLKEKSLREASQPPFGCREQADFWRDFHESFMRLAEEEMEIVQATKKDSYLRAYCTYEEHPEVFEIRRDTAWAFVLFDSTWEQHGETPKIIHEASRNVCGPFCLLKTPECGVWMLSNGVNENFLERFQAVAARAGVALRVPKDTDPTDRWLHWLFDYLLGNKSKQLFAAERGKGGMILRVCEASATFCSRLERKTLEQSGPGNASEVGPNKVEVLLPRKAFLGQLLEEKGFSVHDWAKAAEVDFHTANGYLTGKTKPHPNTLKKLADALGVKVANLPK